MDIYREEILEHYRHPHNFGELHDHDRRVDEANPLCGDNLTLYLKFSGKGQKKVIENVSFTGVGCALSTAAASLLTDNIKGRKVGDLARFDKEAMLKLIGSKVAPARLKCVLLPLEALRQALSVVLPN